MQALGRINKLKKLTLVWTPRHQGIPGNQEVDRLAKAGAIKLTPSQTVVITFSVGKKLIKRHLELEQQDRSAACAGCCQSKTLIRYPLPGRANELRAMSRLRLWAAAGLLTALTTLRAHRYKLGHTER
jgi:hypothetical protein